MMAIYSITPVAKPRQTQSDKWKQRPAVMRYRAFADEVRRLNITIQDANSHIFFRIPMPKSWSKNRKRKMYAQPHQTKRKGDIDNYLKALLDAIFEDDSGVWDIRVTKTWALEGAIEILPDPPQGPDETLCPDCRKLHGTGPDSCSVDFEIWE